MEMPDPPQPTPALASQSGPGEAGGEDTGRGDDLDDEEFARELGVGAGPVEIAADLDEAVAEEPDTVAPAVVAVVVACDGPGLEPTLSSLVAQDYPSLSILVIDSGGREDPTARIAAVAPRAFVRHLDHNVGFAAAANEALTSVEGAAFLLFAHDDVVLEPDAIRVMVEEAYRSNAGIVGPKIVDREHREVLLEVGLAIDHYGVAFSGIEPGEIDQEQHDAVRDVFFVSSAVMLVRADLFKGLGGFDPDTYPGADDLDLCWRARLAGARVLVAPDARVGHGPSGVGPRRDAVFADERRLHRNRLRVLLKSYSTIALVWVLPAALVLDLAEAAALVSTRRFGRARSVLGGWTANLREMRAVMRSRRQTQALRTVGDNAVRELMVRGSARIRNVVTVHLHAGDRLSEVSVRTRAAVDGARARITRPEAASGLVLLAIIVFGARGVISGHVPAVGTFSRWPGAGTLLSAYWDPWRRVGLGAAAPAPPLLAMMGALSTALLGDSALARTIVVAGALPFGAIACYRLVRRLSSSAWPAVAAAAAYGANPLPRNALARGRLGPLVVFALAPVMFGALMRFADDAGERGLVRARIDRRRAVLWLALVAAVAGAAWPAALLFPALVAIAVLAAEPMVGGLRIAARALEVAALGSGLALVLLAPWTLSVIGGDPASFGFMPRVPLALSDVLRFHTGPAGAGGAPWGLYVAAALPLLVATGPRLAWAGRAWMLVATSVALAWVPGRLDVGLAVPAHDGVLVGAALGLAVAVGLGVAAFVDDLRTFLFGWRQVLAVAAAFGLVLPVFGLLPDTFGGRYRMPGRDWGQAVEWMKQERSAGTFRVLWLGDPDVLPMDARFTAGTGYATSVNGVGDVRAVQPAEGGADAVLEESIGLLAAGRTARAGHLLAPMGVRYVALVSRGGPSSGGRSQVDEGVVRSLGLQLDLAVLESEGGMLLYENEAWAPTRSVVAEDRADLVPVDSPDPIAASTRASIDDARPVSGRIGGSKPTGPGMMLWSEAYDRRWRAESGGRRLKHVRAFGWSNGFVLNDEASVSLSYDRDMTRPALLLAQGLAWLLVCVALRRARRSARASSAADLAFERPGPQGQERGA